MKIKNIKKHVFVEKRYKAKCWGNNSLNVVVDNKSSANMNVLFYMLIVYMVTHYTHVPYVLWPLDNL